MTYTTGINNTKGQKPEVMQKRLDANAANPKRIVVTVPMRPIKRAKPSAGKNLSTGV